ncbi:hypothetical protein [Devosia naphthalenivorans]|uniref:hypothetical protein n=1 Tax=Devosia naphthalenivorans TaxID=2082392 RepID=UPI000D3B20E0|nr:hypothetical protein [Devosia naphthalenivorans]
MAVLDDTPLGLPLPHPDNDPRNTDVPRIRAALTMADGFIAGLQAAQAGSLTEAQVADLITAAVDALKGDAPEAFDTLVEIASKLSDNDDAVAVLVGQIAQKADASNTYTRTQVDLALGTKADATATSNALGAKADTSTVNTALLLKAAYDLSNVTQTTVRNKAGTGTMAYRNVTISTAAPSGGVDGDVWVQV